MQYHYIPRSKPMLSEALLEDAPVARGWFGEPVFGRRILAMDGYSNVSEEMNELQDMTPAQYKKWAMDIGTKPRKGFHSELIYSMGNTQTGVEPAKSEVKGQTNQKTNKMNIDKNLLTGSALVGTGAGIIVNAFGVKNPLGWGILAGVAWLAGNTFLRSSAKTTTPATPPATTSTPPEDKLSAVGSQATKQDRAGVGRIIRTTNIPSNARVNTGDKHAGIITDSFSANGGDIWGRLFKKPSTAKMTEDDCKRQGYSYQWCKKHYGGSA